MSTPFASRRQSRRERRRKAALERLGRGKLPPGYQGACVDDGRLHIEWVANGKLGIAVTAGPVTAWVELTPERAADVAAQILNGLPAANSPERPS